MKAKRTTYVEIEEIDEIPEDFFCGRCDGCGCQNCHWTGERQ